MFKSFLIVILVLALALSAVITRPSEISARGFVTAGTQPAAQGPQTVSAALRDVVAKSGDTADQCLPPGYEFKDRVLWVEVVKDGQTLYTGVLSHWIKHDVANSATPTLPKVDKPVVAGLR